MNKNNNPALNFFIWFITIASAYTLLCFIVVLTTQTDFWLFLPGYGIGVYSLVSPVVLFVYGAVYLAYKTYLRARFPVAMLYFNFVYLLFLIGTLIYELVSAKG